MTEQLEIKDIPTIALLLLRGYKLSPRPEGDRVIFCCPRTAEVVQLLADYLEGRLQVPALEYGQAIGKAKALIRLAKGGGTNG